MKPQKEKNLTTILFEQVFEENEKEDHKFNKRIKNNKDRYGKEFL